MFEEQKPAQKIELSQRPAFDLDEILRSRHRPAQHDQQHFRQRIDHLPGLAGIFEDTELINERRTGRLKTSRFEVFHESHRHRSGNPGLLQAIVLA